MAGASWVVRDSWVHDWQVGCVGGGAWRMEWDRTGSGRGGTLWNNVGKPFKTLLIPATAQEMLSILIFPLLALLPLHPAWGNPLSKDLGCRTQPMLAGPCGSTPMLGAGGMGRKMVILSLTWAGKTRKFKKSPHLLCSRKWLIAKNHPSHVSWIRLLGTLFIIQIPILGLTND